MIRRFWSRWARPTPRDTAGEAAAYLAAIVEGSDDAIIAKDLNGVIQSANAAAERIFGYSAAELVGRPVTMLIPPDRQQEEVQILARIRRGERIEHFETLRLGKGGRPIDVSLTVSPVRDASGRLIGASKIARDITERRRLEAERLAAAADRERLLASERAARAEAERANRLKDDFVAMVSHELRTPLNAIVGWTELLAHDQADAVTRRRAVDVMRRNAELQARLISDLLDVSRIVSGKLRLDRRSLDLAAVVEDAMHTIQASADAKGIQVRREFDRDLPPTLGDPARLQQAVWNLLSNAVKFTPKGGSVLITLRRAGANAEIAVVDDGVGIDPAFLPLVFERFRQAESSTTRRFGGLGLGLSIAKELVELHGGTIRAESAGVGKGAAFTVVLPLLAVDTAAQLAADSGIANNGVAQAADQQSLEGVSVLVVDDDADTRDLIQRLLETQGAQVLSAASADEALRILSSTRPDLLVSDIGLPDADGYQLIQRIRSMDAADGAKLPAVALTAFARPEDRTRALRTGYQAHLAKPVQPAELVATVASFADMVGARRRTSRGASRSPGQDSD